MNCSLLVLVVNGLATKERRTALRELNHDRSSQLCTSLQDGVDRARCNAIESWNSEAFCLGELEQIPSDITGDNTSLHAWNVPVAGILGHGFEERNERGLHNA